MLDRADTRSPHLDGSSRPTLAVADAKGHLTMYHLGTDSVSGACSMTRSLTSSVGSRRVKRS
jgi:hypothetical protein